VFFEKLKSVFEFYEKKILSDPNNSISWIQYASYILDKLNLSAARKIFERAIKTINISLIKEKVQFAKQIVPSAHFFYNRPSSYDDQVVQKKWKENTSELLQKLSSYFISNHASNASDFENQFKMYCDETGIKSGEVLQPLRVSVSGEAMGPPIFEILDMLGNQEVMDRINACVDKLSK
jgi:glutamyl-tRNA synthetase